MVGIQLTITWQCDLTETPDETAARQSAQRDRDRQRRNYVDYFEVASWAEFGATPCGVRGPMR